MTVLAEFKKVTKGLANARIAIAQITAEVAAEYHDMDVNYVESITRKEIFPKRQLIAKSHELLIAELSHVVKNYSKGNFALTEFIDILNVVIAESRFFEKSEHDHFDKSIQAAKAAMVTFTDKRMDSIAKKYVAGKITLATFTQMIDELIKISAAGKYGNFDKAIKHAKTVLVNTSLKSITDYTNSMYHLLDENYNPSTIDKTLEANAPIYNEVLNYLIKLGDADAIHKFITDRSVSLSWLTNSEQLTNLVAVINADTAAHLFASAHHLNHLLPAKPLQFQLLDNENFRKAIFSLNPLKLRDTFAAAKWELADFESRYFDLYQATWMMLTQDNVVNELAAQCKLETYLAALDLQQLKILFEKFPAKIMAVLQNEEISKEAHQQLARRLLGLSKATLGDNAYQIVKIGVLEMSDNYNLAEDKDDIYQSPLIAQEIFSQLSGSINYGKITPHAFNFILTNINIMAHEKIKRKTIKLCVSTAGKHMLPSLFLESIDMLAGKNERKAIQLLSFLPDFLHSCKKLDEREIFAVKILADKYYAANPGIKGTAADPVMKALLDNENDKIYGALIFAEGQSVHLQEFLKKSAADYKIPHLLSDELVNGFILGAKIGILGFGTAVVIDKFASMANIVNPIAWITSSIPGNAFMTTAAGIAAALTGAGLGSTIAIVLAPLALSILVGGLMGAITNVGGHGIINTVRRAFEGISNYLRSAETKDNRIHNALVHGLRNANPQALRKQLYNDTNHELRDNLAKTLLDQESKGIAFRGVPAEIIAIVEPIKTNYYDTHKSILFKLPDYVLGNMMSAIAFTLNVATLFVFDLYYPGPVVNYLSYHSQKKLAAAMPDNSPAVLPATPKRTQAQIMRGILPANPATAYLPAAPAANKAPAVAIVSGSNDVELLPAPPAYSPRRRA